MRADPHNSSHLNGSHSSLDHGHPSNTYHSNTTTAQHSSTITPNTNHHPYSSKTMNFRRHPFSVKHGDKIFVAIAILLCVEIGTFSRIYQYLKAPYNHDDDDRQQSISNDENSSKETHVMRSITGNHHNNMGVHQSVSRQASSSSTIVSQRPSDVKPRILFLNDNDFEETIPERQVPELGNTTCCEREPLDFLRPEDMPFLDDCTPMVDWQTTHYPTCNMLHELPLIDDESDGISKSDKNNTATNPKNTEPQVTLINTKGSWRMVWKVSQQQQLKTHDNPDDTDEPENIVLKTLRYDREFDHESFQLQIVDSLAMERLSASPYIANEYGFCGQSVLTEFAPKSGRDLIKRKHLHTWQRLEMAHDLAAALADMHSIDYPYAQNATLTHNDINIANTIQGADGRLKFNDFNIGVLMRWNSSANQECGAPVRFAAPLWRSPEEIMAFNTSRYVQPQHADTYSLGNLLFQVLTTHQPWTWLEPNGPLEVEDVIQRKLNGDLPYIPSKFRNNTKPGMQAIYFATLSCYAFLPQDRPTSYQLANALATALDWTKQGLAKTREEMKALFTFSHPSILSSLRRKSKRSKSFRRSATGNNYTTTTTIRQTPSVMQHNKTKELLLEKAKQVQAAEANHRMIENRRQHAVSTRPRIDLTAARGERRDQGHVEPWTKSDQHDRDNY